MTDSVHILVAINTIAGASAFKALSYP